MVASYIVPVEDTTDEYGRINRNPAVLALARQCKGRVRDMAAIPSGDLVPFTLFTVEADDFGPLDADPRCVLVGKADRFADVLGGAKNEPLAGSAKRADLLATATALKVPTVGISSVGDLASLLLLTLEPAAHPEMYDRPTPFARSSITDNFNRASLGSGWEVTVGTVWTIPSSVAAKPPTAYQTSVIRRTESAFPNNHYSQIDTSVIDNSGDNSQPGSAVRCGAVGNGDCYFIYLEQGSGIQCKKRVATVTTYLTGDSSTVNFATTYTIKLDVTGTTLTIYMSGSSTTSTTDSALASGKPGLYSNTGGSAGIPTYDNFESTDATASGRLLYITPVDGLGNYYRGGVS